MTRLAGRFAMLLVVNVPEDLAIADVRRFMAERLDPVEVTFTIDSVSTVSSDDNNPVEGGTAWTVTVYGSDRPGIVSAITHSLAQQSVNIDDLATRMMPGPSGQVYTMLIDATVPRDVDADTFAAELAEVAKTLGVTCHASPVDADVL
jgi:glycine cleavage system transcriptional repressor